MEVYGFEVGKGLMSGKMISQVISLPIYEKKKKREKKNTPGQQDSHNSEAARAAMG